MAEHDQSYKRLFSHPQMVEDLLCGFVHEEWVNQLDFSTLETVKDSFMSDNLKAVMMTLFGVCAGAPSGYIFSYY